jgi:hypothetical protein
MPRLPGDLVAELQETDLTPPTARSPVLAVD